MILGRISGTLVSTHKHEAYLGYKILVVQPVGPNGDAKGKTFLAIDRVQAGVGDLVLVNDEGNSARKIIGDSNAPIRTVIVGIVDEVTST